MSVENKYKIPPDAIRRTERGTAMDADVFFRIDSDIRSTQAEVERIREQRKERKERKLKKRQNNPQANPRKKNV